MYDEFVTWLETVISAGLPQDGKAVNFNIYEEGEGKWSIQLIVAGSYDPQDDDWACDEIFSSGEDIFEFDLQDEWEKAQEQVVDLISKYLEEGKSADVLKKYDAVCTGFVDGSLLQLYSSEE